MPQLNSGKKCEKKKGREKKRGQDEGKKRRDIVCIKLFSRNKQYLLLDVSLYY